MTYITQLTGRKTMSIWQIMTMVFAGFVLAVLQSSTVQAQWTTNGNNINNTNTGNVGVGTTTPVQKLQVVGGQFGVFTSSSTGGATISGDAQAGATSIFSDYLGGSEPKLHLSTYSGRATAAGLTIDTAGNVGIATTAPSTKLEVVGNINAKLALNAPATTDVRHIFNGASAWLGQDATNGELNFGYNLYYNNGFKYRIAAQAANIRMYQGAFQFQTAGTGSANGAISWTDGMVILANGNVGIGTATPNSNYKLDVNGNTNVTGNLNVTGNINAKYQDVAEWVQSSQVLPAGTVVVLDHTRSNQVIASSQAYDTRVAGVISLQPGITLGENGAGKVLVATTGRVRIKVDASRGSIQVGDLLVTSDVPGFAMKSQPIDVGGVQIHRPGTLIGKALETLARGSGEILVLLSLQ